MTDAEEKLVHMYEGQLAQLAYRRARENEIFTWSSTILIGFIGVAVLFTDENRAVLLREWIGAAIAAAVMLVVTAFSIRWQWKQRKYLAETQRLVVQIETALGFFEHPKVPYPADWSKWGTKDPNLSDRIVRPTKVAATAVLGVLAILAALVSPIVAGSLDAQGRDAVRSGVTRSGR